MTADVWLRGDWMQTNSGRRFYPQDPRPEEIDAGDIAHALSLLCRYGGHVDRFYSVAEHCVLMSEAIAPEFALTALLHDATEAYVVDVPRPVKRYLPEYAVLEQKVWSAITTRFGLPAYIGLPPEVKEVDNRILLNERATLLRNAEVGVWNDIETMEPLPVVVEGWLPAEAEARYIARLNELVNA